MRRNSKIRPPSSAAAIEDKQGQYDTVPQADMELDNMESGKKRPLLG